MRLDSRGVRVWSAGLLFVAFLAIYSAMLFDFATVRIPDANEMGTYLRRSRTFRELLFIIYLASIGIMSLSAKSQFEKEVLATGIFSVLVISLLRTLHNLSILVMSNQLLLIKISFVSMAFILIVLRNAKKHNIDGE